MIQYNVDTERFDVVVGSIAGWMEFNPEEGYIHGIYISPEFRKRGLAEACIAFAKETTLLFPLVIEITNPVLYHVAERNGFVRVESVMRDSARYEFA